MEKLLRVCFLMVLLAPAAAPLALGGDAPSSTSSESRAGDSAREREIRKYRQQLERQPGDVSARLELARNLAWAGRHAEARRECQRVQADSRDRETKFQARKLEAQVLSWSGNQKRAGEIYSELLKERPKDVELQVGLANTLSWSGWSRRARAEYEEILRSSQSPDAVLGLAEIARMEEQWDEAEGHYRRVLKARPRDPWAVRGLEQLRRSTMITLGVGAGFYRDSTEFERDRYGAAVDLLRRSRIPLRTGLVRSRYEDGSGDQIYRTTLPIQGFLRVTPMFSLSAGLSRNDYSDAPDTTSFFLHATLAPDGDRVRVRLGFDHYDLIDGADPLAEYRYNQVKSIEVAREEIDVDEARAGIFLRFTGRLTLDADLARGEYSDGNLRYTSYSRLSYRMPTKPRLDLFAALYYQNVEDPSLLYWDPSNFQSYAVGALWEDSWEGMFRYALEGQVAFHPNEEDLLGGQLQGYAEWDLGEYLSVRGSAMYLTSPEDRSGTGERYDAYYVSGLLISRFPPRGHAGEAAGARKR